MHSSVAVSEPYTTADNWVDGGDVLLARVEQSMQRNASAFLFGAKPARPPDLPNLL